MHYTEESMRNCPKTQGGGSVCEEKQTVLANWVTAQFDQWNVLFFPCPSPCSCTPSSGVPRNNRRLLTFQLQDGGVENYRINVILFVYLLQRLKCTKRDQTIHEIAFFFYVHFFAGRLFSTFCKLFEQITYRSKVVNLGSNTYFHFLKEIFWEVKTHEKSNPILFIPFMKKINKITTGERCIKRKLNTKPKLLVTAEAYLAATFDTNIQDFFDLWIQWVSIICGVTKLQILDQGR